MAPNISIIVFILIQLVYFSVAGFEETRIEGDGNYPEQSPADVKNEYEKFINIKGVRERIKLFRNILEQELFAEFANANHELNVEIEPLSHFRDLTLKMIRQVSAKGASREVQVDAVVTFLTEVISQEIPNSTDIQPTEMAYGKKQYLCMSSGRVTGLKSLRHTNTKIITNTDSVDLHITYVLNNLHVHYGLVYVQMWPWTSTNGVLDFDFGKNKINVVLNLPKFDTLIKNILLKDCFVRLKDLSVKKLEYRNARLTGVEENVSFLLSSLMDSFFKVNKAMLKMKFETKILEEVHHSLRTSANFVCNDDRFAALILKKGGSLTDTESDDFKRHCGSGSSQKHDE